MGDPLFEIDPDIRVARTLPARVYSDPEIFCLRGPHAEELAPVVKVLSGT